MSEDVFDDSKRLYDCTVQAIPKDNPNIIEWAEANVKLPSSARSKNFNMSITPWIQEPLERMVDLTTRVVTLMKPVQSGGSTVGEVVILYWIMFWHGFIQYNWSKDKRADERWSSRIKQLFEACPPVAERMSKLVVKTGEVDFGNAFFRMQGAFVSSNLDSDTIPMQINEEIHDWEPGHLKKAEGRSTAVWNFKRGNISNAGLKGDQLDQAQSEGTNQIWEVKCPGCGGYHPMRERWDDKRPDLGGIRYDASKARLGAFKYDYNVLRPTVHYQFPCGYRVHNEDVTQRRQLSLSGRYSQPRNTGALLSNRSYTFDAACVDYIDYMTLIQEKHDALKARAGGDPEPYIKYSKERACLPYDPNAVPLAGKIDIIVTQKKNRDGLPFPRLRYTNIDRQQGNRDKGELPYWWVLIRDFKLFYGALRSMLVYEGKKETDEQVISVMDDHKVERYHACADSGDDTDHVYNFCMRYGIHAIKGGTEGWYAHEGGAKRMYSPEKPLHSMMNFPSKFPYVPDPTTGIMVPDVREPMFWLYSKSAIREHLNWLRTSSQWEVPGDVSEDYLSHMEAENRITEPHAITGENITKWIQVRDRNDLFVCECYASMMLSMSGEIGEAYNQIQHNVQTQNKTK